MKRAESIEVIVRGVCIKDGKILLCHTQGASNTYLPGGHVEFREQAAQSLIREIREELGVSGRVGRFLGSVENAFLQKGVPHSEINLIFELKLPGVGSAKTPHSKEDYIDFLWFPLSRLSRSRLEPAVLRRLLPVWLGRRASGSCWVTAGAEWRKA